MILKMKVLSDYLDDGAMYFTLLGKGVVFEPDFLGGSSKESLYIRKRFFGGIDFRWKT